MSLPLPNDQGDSQYLLAYRSLQGVQVASVAATPLYVVHAIRRARFSFKGLARYNWVVPVIGSAAGLATGWAQASQMTPAVLSRRVREFRGDAARIRLDDYHLIGSVVGALVLPAIFLRRVGLFNGLLGGAGLGGGVGIITHFARDYMDHGSDSSAGKLFSGLKGVEKEAKASADRLASNAGDLKQRAGESADQVTANAKDVKGRAEDAAGKFVGNVEELKSQAEQKLSK